MLSFEVKGGLFSADLLEDLSSRQGQSPDDFGLPPDKRVTEEASRTLATARNQWAIFKNTKERLGPRDSDETATRVQWVLPLLNFLGYELQYQRSNEVIGESSFAISHRAVNKDQFPVHISGFRQSLDENPEASRGMRGKRESAHVQMQEYLNHTEHLYGIITNGYKLRLLRDHHRLTGIQYLEWDLEQLMEENDLASFAMLYRMLHVSRIPKRQGEDSLLEQYHQHSVEEGHRVRDKLKAAVFQCLQLLGNGFITHPDNDDLRAALASREVSAIAYGQYLRTLVYRLLFLFVAEDRRLVFAPGSDPTAQQLYREHYSLNRFRNLAEAYITANGRHSDVWEQLKATFRLFEEEGIGAPLAIAPLGGELFAVDALGALRTAKIDNRTFLKAIDLLSRFEQEKGQRIRINYRRINVEEFGAVYESLLELNPEVTLNNGKASFQYIDGESRKGTGSYYTHQDLVKQLLKTTLEPVMKERLDAAEADIHDFEARRKTKAEALLTITVCDPACGSGHFLVAAARALAGQLALLRAPRGASVDKYERQAMRDVIEHCIYGVDLNPDAAELCRLVLWIEAHEAGKPITYLDHKIRCGNSLVGWLGELKFPVIPDGAFDPIPGDDKAIAKAWKLRNASAMHHTIAIPFEEKDHTEWRSQVDEFNTVDRNKVGSLEDYWRKKAVHQQWEQNDWTAHQRTLLNLWAYAFFQPYDDSQRPVVINEVLDAFREGRLNRDSMLLKEVEAEAKAARFFHWPIEFPNVFERGGFDVLLGNPPWSQIMLKEKQFFAGRKPEIVKAKNAAERKKLIAALDPEDPDAMAFYRARRYADSTRKYVRFSHQYNLTTGGRANTYSVFSERGLSLVSGFGRLGSILPTGIATDHTNRLFFWNLIQKNRLISLLDFENRKSLFPEVSGLLKFCLLTVVGEEGDRIVEPEFGFYLHQVSDLNLKQRLFRLSKKDFVLINPNTKTCPILRTEADAELVRAVYARNPTLDNADGKDEFTWGAKFLLMFNMSSDSEHFLSLQNIQRKYQNKEQERSLIHEGIEYMQVYEAKMFWLYNHRYSTYSEAAQRDDGTEKLMDDTLRNPVNYGCGWYWIDKRRVQESLFLNQSSSRWGLGFRKISASCNERTFVTAILPSAGFSDSCPLIISEHKNTVACALVSMLSSLVLDFVAKQKLGGNNFGHFVVKQLPVIPPNDFKAVDLHFLVPRVLELTYTAWDLKYFADDVWNDADETLRELIAQRWNHNKQLISIPAELEASFEKPDWVDTQVDEFPLKPFRWDSDHRHRVQSELDAFFAMKYGLNEEELKYILDPKLSTLAGETEEEREAFPGETFRVLKEKELKKYREYRTARLVLEAWEAKPWERPEELPDQVATSPTEVKRRNYMLMRTMAPVMARIIQRNEHPRYKSLLGRTKMEKVLHMIEAETALDFGRLPQKHHYGPADLVALDGAIKVAEGADAFQQKQHNAKDSDEGFFYQKLEGFKEMVEQFESDAAAQLAAVDHIIDLFAPFNRERCELITTVYATWNNLLIAGVLPISENMENDERIIMESHEWSAAKKSKFRPGDFIEPLQWLRANGLVPKGEGKEVV